MVLLLEIAFLTFAFLIFNNHEQTETTRKKRYRHTALCNSGINYWSIYQAGFYWVDNWSRPWLDGGPADLGTQIICNKTEHTNEQYKNKYR
jgi:hypothetical protein